MAGLEEDALDLGAGGWADLEECDVEPAAAHEDAMHEDGEPEEGTPQPPAAPQTEDGEPNEGTPQPPAAVPVGGSPAQRAPAGKPGAGTRRRSNFAFVYWDPNAKPGNRGYFGQLAPSSTHPYLRTPGFRTDAEAARAVDRLLYKVRGPEACNFPVTPELAAELDALTLEQIQQQLRAASRAIGPKEGKTSCFKGVRRIPGTTGRWQAAVYAKQPTGRSKQVALGSHATEQEAAERVSAAAHVLGDRCASRDVPLERYANLTAEQGRALAVEVLGPAAAARLQQAMQGLLPVRQRADGAPRRKRRRGAERRQSSSEEEEEEEGEEEEGGEEEEEEGDEGQDDEVMDWEVQLDLGAETDEAALQAADASGAQPAPNHHQQRPPLDTSGAGVQARLTYGMVADAWLDVWQGLVERHAATGQAPAPSDTSVGCAPHPAVLASAAAAHPGDSPGRQQQAAALAWRAAQAQAEAYAAELGDASLLNPNSLHRLTFLVAYSVLWLHHSGQPHQDQPSLAGP